MDRTTSNAREMYDKYNVGHYSYGKKRALYDPFLLEFLSAIGVGKKLYDIGCGSGFWLDMYVARGIAQKDIVGVDLSPQNIEFIKARGFQAFCDNVLELRLKDNVSDFTVCNGVIHHTSDPLQAFKELVRITKPGGSIYLAVYNVWNPYYYIVHKAAFPLRYWYWNKNKRILDFVLPFAKLLMQPFSLLFFKEFLDDKTMKTIFMDQVMTPRADLFSKRKIRRWALQNDCDMTKIKYVKCFLMVAAIIEVKKIGDNIPF